MRDNIYIYRERDFINVHIHVYVPIFFFGELYGCVATHKNIASRMETFQPHQTNTSMQFSFSHLPIFRTPGHQTAALARKTGLGADVNHRYDYSEEAVGNKSPTFLHHVVILHVGLQSILELNTNTRLKHVTGKPSKDRVNDLSVSTDENGNWPSRLAWQVWSMAFPTSGWNWLQSNNSCWDLAWWYFNW